MNLDVSDIELTERLQKGDLEAFDLIYARYSGKLLAFGQKYLRSNGEAEELVHSVFMKIWENRNKLRSQLSFKSYLFTIAYNEICKIFRTRKHFNKYRDDYLYSGSDSTNEVENSIQARSLLEEVQKIIDQLPEKQKAIFMESWKAGKSSRKIAEDFGMASGTIDNYISDSLKFIRRRIKKENLLVITYFIWYFMS